MVNKRRVSGPAKVAANLPRPPANVYRKHGFQHPEPGLADGIFHALPVGLRASEPLALLEE